MCMGFIRGAELTKSLLISCEIHCEEKLSLGPFFQQFQTVSVYLFNVPKCDWVAAHKGKQNKTHNGTIIHPAYNSNR